MDFKDSFFSKKHTINFNGVPMDLTSPKVMGILNITPDSFFDGGRYLNEADIVARCQTMLNEGADIIDVGAYSSRPGADEISVTEEKNRLKIALNAIRNKFPECKISVDTFRSEIAQFVASEFNVGMINDISAGNLDPMMAETIARLGIPYVMMHMVGTPQNMQQHTQYNNLLQDIIKYFSVKINTAVNLGIKDIIIDPGFGFSKTLEHNYQLLQNLEMLHILEKPLLVGLSRKSMIYKLLQNSPEDALTGTIAVNTMAISKGAHIVRVHDVRAAREIITIWEKIKNAPVNNVM